MYKDSYSTPSVFNEVSSQKYQENEIQCVNIAKVVNHERKRQSMYPKCHLFLICVPVLSSHHLQEVLDIWIPEIRFKCPYAPYIIVGTKKDQLEDKELVEKMQKEGYTPITKEEGVNFAKNNRAYTYIDCSAKTGEGFDIIFDKIIEAENENIVKSPKNVLEKKDSCIPQ